MSHLMSDELPVQKATIIARGKALGYTLNMPEEERYLHTKEELVDWMVVTLAGRAAEQVVFGRVTNGAANDLEKVTDARPLDGLRVRHGRERRVAHDARRQLRALRGDEAPCATRSRRASPTTPTSRPSPHREAPRARSTASPTRCSRRRRSSREELLELFGDVEPGVARVRDHRCRPGARRRRLGLASAAGRARPPTSLSFVIVDRVLGRLELVRPRPSRRTRSPGESVAALDLPERVGLAPRSRCRACRRCSWPSTMAIAGCRGPSSPRPSRRVMPAEDLLGEQLLDVGQRRERREVARVAPAPGPTCRGKCTATSRRLAPEGSRRP